MNIGKRTFACVRFQKSSHMTLDKSTHESTQLFKFSKGWERGEEEPRVLFHSSRTDIRNPVEPTY